MKKLITNQPSLKRLASYSAMAGAFVLVNSEANGQIVYTDVVPDESIGTAEPYDLDMNNDGEIDFTLNIFSTTIPDFFYTVASHLLYYDALINIMRVYPSPGNAVIAYSVSTASGGTLAYPNALNNGESVGPGASFFENSTQNLGAYLSVVDFPAPGSNTAYKSYGAWPTKSSKFLGVRFNADGEDLYGWVRLSIDNVEITIEDYAYNAAGDGLDAGDMPTGIHNAIAENQLHAYSFGNTVNIVVTDLKAENANVKIFNMEGKVVYSNALNFSGMNISLENAATGNYTLQVVTGSQDVYTKQLYIQQ